ncbi:Cytochrome c4 [Methylophaga frappieri]|jgi:cytochrome c553|uniref:Cytochrome c4 n=1 Tax=Methylophaga frappieri (strain ATCC BAA-2434 / DSM 25690 / JAM7) TaxID=754477 RepID=I1YIM3_METFJ|nr:c-type cytochrome [Methylophaga frappieri]AFJ02766.1 Cytochrome c4 [Methylophaga frappieri]
MKKFVLAVISSLIIINSAQLAAAGDVSAGKQKSAACAACHAADGNSPSPDFPKLAGQNAGYIAKQLSDFKSGARENAIMAPIAQGLSEQDMLDLAAYFASQEVAAGAVAEDLIEAGRQLYRGGNAQSGVPACMACHGPNGKGIPSAKWPMLSSQYSKYTETQLHQFAKGNRANDPNSMMRDIAGRLSEAEIKAVSAYVSGLH